ncbi:MAG TPA: type IV pilus twitching motility protein PilT [Gemmatimonadota bacterium]|nr:type IV pilus twitching motility protein PilT [Gemmatimonadota bacterium]
MARIDRYIQELFAEGGRRLTVVSGEPVRLLGEGESTTLGRGSPSVEQVEALLREILPPGSADAADPGRHEFTYEAPAGRVEVRAYRTEDALRLLVLPNGPASEGNGAAGPDEEAAPAADAGGDAGPDGGAGDASPGAATPDAGQAPAAGSRAGPGGESAAAPSTREAEASAGDERLGSAGADAADAAAPGPEAPLIVRLFHAMVEHGCSDLHVSAGNPPLFRKDGQMVDLGGWETLDPEQTRKVLFEITPDRNRAEFGETHDTDFAYEIGGLARFRCNLFMDRKGVGGVFRQIPADIMTAEDLGLPEAVLDLCHLSKGLVVVTGPTGSGKSTTLAAMIDHINDTRRDHVITIEDPIEFVHESKRCLINQREVGVHTQGFKRALRAALREDPDIVLVGEMRDLETVEIALETAETGHLVFGTLHTNTAPSTVDRIIDQFPASQQNQIRTMLSESLKGVIAQTLCRRKEGGRTAALEILIVSNAVSNLIREGKTFQIPSVIQTSKGQGMATLNDSLFELVRTGEIEPAEAYRKAVARSELRTHLERNGYEVASPEPGA